MVALMNYFKIHKGDEKKMRRKKIDLVVFRMNDEGNLLNSRPCRDCILVMQKYIRKVWYSTPDGYVCERVMDMNTDYVSSASRRNDVGLISTLFKVC